MRAIEMPLVQASAIASRLMERGLLPAVTHITLDIHVGMYQDHPGPGYWLRDGFPQVCLSNGITEACLSELECQHAHDHAGAVGLLLCVLDAARTLVARTEAMAERSTAAPTEATGAE